MIMSGQNIRIQPVLPAGSAMRIHPAVSAHDHVLPESSGCVNPSVVHIDATTRARVCADVPEGHRITISSFRRAGYEQCILITCNHPEIHRIGYGFSVAMSG